jgi:hypothetical protein
MANYKAEPFSVTFLWLENGKWRRKRFDKYLVGLAWVNGNITADEVVVRIIGVIKQSNSADSREEDK